MLSEVCRALRKSQRKKKDLASDRLRRQTKILSGIQESSGGSKNQKPRQAAAVCFHKSAWTGALGSPKIQSKKDSPGAQIQLNQHNMVKNTQHT
jgi:hypothetical protein